jgi:hypothetical protein
MLNLLSAKPEGRSIMTLNDVAREMHLWAETHGHMDYNLSSGLKLKLIYREKDIVLRMSRGIGVLPSEAEIKICKKAFFGDKELSNCAETDNAVFIAIKRVTQEADNHAG